MRDATELGYRPLDPLTIVAGGPHESFPAFLALLGIAKTVRYLTVTGLTLGWM